MKQSKEEIVDMGTALVEMYKAGFLDGYRSAGGKIKKKEDFDLMNKKYKKAFNKRFGKFITKTLKEKKNGRRTKRNSK